MSKIVLGREFKFVRIPVYLVRILVRILTFPVNFISESTSKNSVRKVVLKFQNSLPLELAISKGQTAIQNWYS